MVAIIFITFNVMLCIRMFLFIHLVKFVRRKEALGIVFLLLTLIFTCITFFAHLTTNKK